MEDAVLSAKLDNLLTLGAANQATLVALVQQLRDHTEQDSNNFDALRADVSATRDKAAEAATGVVALKAAEDAARDAGKVSGGRSGRNWGMAGGAVAAAGTISVVQLLQALEFFSALKKAILAAAGAPQ